jgi:hypothetical protein
VDIGARELQCVREENESCTQSSRHTLERFYEDRLVSDLAAAAVSHWSEDKRGRRP